MKHTTPLNTGRVLIGCLYWPRRSASYATAITHHTRPSLIRRIVSALRSTR